MSNIRVLIADDHPVVRDGIRYLLKQETDIEVVGEAADGFEALHLTQSVKPDILLLDMELPGLNGTEVAKKIMEERLPVKILALSAHDDPIYIRSLLELGAAGYLMKEEAPQVIVQAIRGVAEGLQGWVSRNIAAQMASMMRGNTDSKPLLTPRETEILRLVVDGRTNQGIGVALGISEKTVEKYLDSIFTKLDVSSRTEAAVYAVREGLA
jgi:two-component system response regulator DegU